MIVRFCLLALLILSPSWAIAAKKMTPKPNDGAPKIMSVSPLAVLPGTTRIDVVGLKVDQVRSIVIGAADQGPTTLPGSDDHQSVAADGVSAGIIDKSKIDVSRGMDPNTAGDSMVQIDLVVPKSYSKDEIPLALVLANGNRLNFGVLLKKTGELVSAAESSPGFQDAQLVHSGQWVRGTVRSPGQVTVFRISAKRGQTLVAEVVAQRRHSLLDSLLVLYDSVHNFVAENDDANDADSLIHCVLPSDGDYFLSLTDALAHGGNGYPYLLSISVINDPR